MGIVFIQVGYGNTKPQIRKWAGSASTVKGAAEELCKSFNEDRQRPASTVLELGLSYIIYTAFLGYIQVFNWKERDKALEEYREFKEYCL